VWLEIGEGVGGERYMNFVFWISFTLLIFIGMSGIHSKFLGNEIIWAHY